MGLFISSGTVYGHWILTQGAGLYLEKLRILNINENLFQPDWPWSMDSWGNKRFPEIWWVSWWPQKNHGRFVGQKTNIVDGWKILTTI